MDRLAHLVVERFLRASGEGDFKKYRTLIEKASAEMRLLPRLLDTYDRQAHGYKTQNLEKAKATQDKAIAKIKSVQEGYEKAFDLAKKFDASYKPTTDFKKRIYTEDFAGWMQKGRAALSELEKMVKGLDDYFPPIGLSSGLDGSFVAPGHNPLVDVQRATGGIAGYWAELIKPDPDPVDIPKDGSDEERFMAFLTPSIRRLAKSVASKIKKNKSIAAALVFKVLEDVNAHSSSTIAEGIVSPLIENDEQIVPNYTTDISHAIDYGLVEAGVFGVALMEEVGAKSTADQLKKALAGEMAEYTTG
jgi:hypothetical protein